jgi:hypothetical protein
LISHAAKSVMSIFGGAPIKSSIGTKGDVVGCGNNCLSYNGNNGSLLSAGCRHGSARHPIRLGLSGQGDEDVDAIQSRPAMEKTREVPRE